MANRATHLHPICKVQALSQPPPLITPSVDVNALTSVLLLQTLTKSGLIPSSTPATPTPTSCPVLPPVTPTRGDTEKISSSPLLLLPTQLSLFLRFAEANLGISNTSRYEVKLELQGISPDILVEVNDCYAPFA
ncbi:hypothetical protein PISMIDRAFT_12181 [Pisolithus microcarpus 441]|uniref:Uncharacterized protein n=1 Tax=Pisolithus microcarpus 441 TaxID=765257 RepID=A0A0C9Z628_9AGAM|nr:hypothetical protein PISMIDRAFT_12181 [Pisolithus microcarpus 441]